MQIPIDLLIHSRRKTVAIIIQRDGALTVRAPIRMSDERIREFVQNHAEWIRKKQALIKSSPTLLKKQYIDGETFLYLGNDYPLSIVTHQRLSLTFDGNNFCLAKSILPKAKQVFIRWYKAQALAMISRRVAFLAVQNNFMYKKIRISSARTRWGSCSTNGTLSFTWRLVLAPPEVIDYVVIHELVHTHIRNHSPKFWHKVAEILPAYKKHVAWLKKTGHYLTLGED